MKTIAFHSYKGGVGRTKIMVGLGARLAAEGFQVCMIDLDVDASGLASIFDHEREAIGTRELLYILERGNASLVIDAVKDVTDLVRERSGGRNVKGWLKYVPTISDPELADKINWGEAGDTLKEISEHLLDPCNANVLLVDLKPGYSISSAAALPLMDQVVVVTRIDCQNIRGLEQTVPHFIAQGLSPILVANLLPKSEKTKAGLESMQDALRAAIKESGHDLQDGEELVQAAIYYDPDVFFDQDFAMVSQDSMMAMGVETVMKKLEL